MHSMLPPAALPASNQIAKKMRKRKEKRKSTSEASTLTTTPIVIHTQRALQPI